MAIEDYRVGAWYVTHWASHPFVHISEFDGGSMTFIANCGNPNDDGILPHNANAELNAQFIETAHANCSAINESNPQAVAESIKDMHYALQLTKAFMHSLEKQDPKLFNNASIIMLKTNIESALAKTEAK
jgi:hypothetical protein